LTPAGPEGKNALTTRRLLIALTFVLLIAVSVSVGVLVARWPHLRELWFH
jgi:hypothetical protein